jgi:hypothetical protein
MRRALALAVIVLACSPGGTDETDTGAETGTTGEPIPEPAFLNPAVGEFTISTNQLVPETLVVERVIPGLTEVLFDGFSLGSLTADSPLGTLSTDSLALTVRGALVAGDHTLQLLNESPDGPLTSVTLTMVIAPPDPEARPTWRTELAPTAITGTSLLAAGRGPARLLGVVREDVPDPVLLLLRPADPGWAVEDPIAVPLPGHVPDAMSQTPAVSFVALPDERMRVAFRVGMPGAAIAVRDIVLEPTPTLREPTTAFDLTAALGDDPAEWAAFGRPFALGHTIVAELLAPADTEVPHPGDRRLIASLWRGDDLGWTPPTQVGMPSPTDLDALGPALDLSAIQTGRPDSLSVRLGGAYSGLLAASDDGSITITTPARTAPIPLVGDLALATILGDFGGRTVVAVDSDGRVAVALLQMSGDNPARTASPPQADLPAAIPTGAPAPGLGLGFPVFLIPYGDAAPVHLVLSDGLEPVVVPLDQPEPVHCDAVALAATLTGNDPEAPALALACLSHGVLQVGRLIVEPHGG